LQKEVSDIVTKELIRSILDAVGLESIIPSQDTSRAESITDEEK